MGPRRVVLFCQQGPHQSRRGPRRPATAAAATTSPFSRRPLGPLTAAVAPPGGRPSNATCVLGGGARRFIALETKDAWTRRCGAASRPGGASAVGGGATASRRAVPPRVSTQPPKDHRRAVRAPLSQREGGDLPRLAANHRGLQLRGRRQRPLAVGTLAAGGPTERSQRWPVPFSPSDLAAHTRQNPHHPQPGGGPVRMVGRSARSVRWGSARRGRGIP